jgi:autotransporter passenger strand-loop-strand repeat protein
LSRLINFQIKIVGLSSPFFFGLTPALTASGAIVNSGGVEYVSSGGVASSTVVIGGNDDIYSGGVANGTILRSTVVVSSTNPGAMETVVIGGAEYLSGGTASGTTVNSGSREIVSSGGTAIGATINSGGTEYVSSGGVASGTIVSSGGTEIVSSGGASYNTTVYNGGTLTVAAGGTSTTATLNTESVSSASIASSAIPVVSNLTLSAGATVDFTGISASVVSAVSINAANQLVASDANGNVLNQLSLTGSYSGMSFIASSDGNGGTNIRVMPNVASAVTQELASHGIGLPQAEQYIMTNVNTNPGAIFNSAMVYGVTFGMLSQMTAYSVTAIDTYFLNYLGGTSLGLLPSTVTAISNSTPGATLTGILGAGNGYATTFLSGDNIALTGGNTTLNLFDLSSSGTALPSGISVSGVNTVNLTASGSIGSADDFSGWSGLTTLYAAVSGTGSVANGLVNVTAGNGTAVNLTANDVYSTTSGQSSQTVGTITLNGGSTDRITENIGATDGSAIIGGVITVNGGSNTTGVSVTQSPAVSGQVTDGAVVLNDVSANSASLTGVLSNVSLNNYGSGSAINDNALSALSLSGAGGTLTLNNSNVAASSSTLQLTLNGLSAAVDNTITDRNSEIVTLNINNTGTTASTLSGFNDSHLSSVNLQGSSGFTLLNPIASVTSYSLGSHTGVDSLSMAANSSGSVGNLTTISGAQHGDQLIIADATQFNNTAITATNVTASGGDPATLAGWVNAALSAQGANLPSHGVGWFTFNNKTYLIEQAHSPGAAFTSGDTLVQLVGTGTTNESVATISGHTLTL